MTNYVGTIQNRNGAFRLRSLIASFVLVICFLPSLSPSAANGASNSDECKLNWKFAGEINLGFPKSPNRLKSSGKERIFVVGVDFKNEPYRGNPDNIKQHLIDYVNPELVSKFYQINSYGNFDVDFEFHPKLMTLPDKNKYLSTKIGQTFSRELQQEVVKELDETGTVAWKNYSAVIVYVVQPVRQTPTPFIGDLTPTATATDKSTFTVKSGSISNAIFLPMTEVELYNSNREKWLWVDPARWTIVAHEIGHLLGFIDIYLINSAHYLANTMGPFDLMNHGWYKSPSLTAWHRWTQGWLQDSQVICSTDSKDFSGRLTDLNTAGGVKLALIKLSETQLLAAESRSSGVIDDVSQDKGLLVYLIDLNIQSGYGAMRMIAKKTPQTTVQINENILDSERFYDGVLRSGDYVQYQDVLIHVEKDDLSGFLINIKRSDNFSELISSLNSKAVEEKVKNTYLLEQAARDESILKSNGQSLGTLIEGSECANPDFLTILQSKNNGIWTDVAPAMGWIKYLSCPFESLYKPWVVAEFPEGTPLRWKIERLSWKGWRNPPFTKYSTEFTSVASKAQIKRQEEAKYAAELKARQEAEAKAAAELRAKQEAEAAAKAAAAKKMTITCIKGKTVKKVTAVKPKCPSGYKKK